jgi:adenosylmethionine-8-amino-7-oxononanoate aminotransferase
MSDQQARALRHLWLHFTRMDAYREERLPILVAGDGCYVTDADGRRYLDGFSSQFVTQIGHGRRELADAAAEQMSRLAFYPIWSHAHAPAIDLAERIAGLAPGDLNRVFFTTGGSEAVESAWKLAIQYHRANGQAGRHKMISRNLAYHGTTMGALSLTGVSGYRTPFEPLVPGAIKVQNTNRYRCIDCSGLDACSLRCADDIEQRILMEGPETVAAVILEPLQNAGGAFAPPPGYWSRVREICDRYGVLLISDEVICAFGRLGTWYGADRYGYQPDILTFAKGITSGYLPLGGCIASDRIYDAIDEGLFLHGITFGGHATACAVALANLEVMEEERVLQNVQAQMPRFQELLESLRDIPIVGDVRGDGFFWAIELVKDRDSRASFTDEEANELLSGFLSPRLIELGLLCRTDDRGDPAVILAPPLIAGEPELSFMHDALRQALSETRERFSRAGGAGQLVAEPAR